MFNLFIFLIFVFCREILLVNSTDELGFWTEHQEVEVGRENANASEMTSKFSNRAQLLFNKWKYTASGTKNTKTLGKEQRKITTPEVPEIRLRANILRSTWVTPMGLKQQTVLETTTADTSDEDFYQMLSPYRIKNDMNQLVNKFPKANISVEVIGRTIEYNDIVMLKITERKGDASKYFRAAESKYIDDLPEKKIVFIVHGLSVMGLDIMPCLGYTPKLAELMSYYFEHLDKFDIFLIPMANPDGFSRRGNLWNKNMSPQGACPGVSLDRNFDVAWNSSHGLNSCSQHYPGPGPLSEDETFAISDVFHRYSHKIIAYFHVHAGTYEYFNFKGDAVLYPKGYTDVQNDDDKYIDLRGEIDEAMKNASFQILSVTVDTLYNWYGKISGSSVDYASTVYGVPYSMELVMQPYKDSNSIALREIWKRVIDVIFNHMWQDTNNNEVK